jgi:hypothetical protein
MSIQRAARPSSGYTLIRDEVLRDSRLSYRARGVLAAILSRPDNWTTTAEKLAGEGSEGRDAIRTALAELEEAGYIERRSVQGPGGRWSTQTLVYDQPRPVAAPMPENPSPVAENPPPTPEKPTTGKPTVGFPGPIKNNHEEQPTTSDDEESTFDDFYAAYPRRIDRGHAVKAWKAAVKKAPASVIVAAAREFSEQCADGDTKFVPYPATWLNGERWADSPPELAAVSGDWFPGA